MQTCNEVIGLKVINVQAKIHWASKETYHFFRATLTKIHFIKISNIWAQISFNIPSWEYLKNTRFSRIKKERTWLNHERPFFENHRNCSPSELHGGSLFRTFNSYSFNFNGGLRKCCTGFCLLRTPSPRGKQFLWLLKLTSCDFIAFISSMIEVNFWFFNVLIKDKFT